ncbi:prohibitin family protein [Pedobacter cryophilus]|uniref:Prohibitin family protein n=1 Tax=Pedobacter cryophilus TaxID=2571271 RepID=A0A4U1C4F2_9SPHI|nr:prohibitin family protein [Pedobacter cryophilus]TKC00766.1 prohibitin family protein [Pedobacter cryophilus]
MILIVLGVFAFIIGSVLSKQGNPATEKTSKLLYVVGPVLILIGVFTSCFKTVEPGQVGVKSLFGKVDDQVLYSGLNFVNPLVKITTFDVRTQNYTMSASHEEGTQKGDDAIRILTADGLEVVIDLSVLFNVKSSEAPKILQQIGTDYLDKIVRPVSRTAIRDNAVSYDAVALYSSKRDEFQNKIYKTIEKSFADRGLRLEQLLIRNITLPASVKASIESKINAEQDAQKMTFVLQKEKQEAERKRVEAQGIADYQKILSTGLSDKQLQYESIKAQKEIATSPNTKVIIMGSGKNPVIIGGN